ncbi:MAG: ABC transporter ATP-binding protein [Phycisphaerales bacterium]|nr:MAG: ABC transporter ATP-binding protein [Phycisphaerales bacterium]
MIIARRLTRRFGRITAVDRVDFTVPKGEVVGFLGPNGAGKTTTIRMITGYLPPTRGDVLVDSLSVGRNVQKVRRRIGYLPESTPLYGEMRVLEFLKMRAKLFGITRSRRRQAIDLALRRCWLTDVRRRPINQLSRGFRQRVGLAAALLHEPPVLILDEPTVGLDPAQVREMRSLIRELAGRHTILLSSHILSEVELTCDRIIVIDRGCIRGQGAIEELKAAATGTARYVVEADAADAASALDSIDGVASIQVTHLDDKWHRLVITAAEGADDLRGPIARALGGQGATVRELVRLTPSLEQLFVRLLAEESSGSEINDVVEGGGSR